MKIKFLGIIDLDKALAAVNKNGNVLQYVKNQTEVVVLAAVNQNGYALQYIKDKTEAVALAAVKQNNDALQYVLDFDLFVKIAKQLDIEID